MFGCIDAGLASVYLAIESYKTGIIGTTIDTPTSLGASLYIWLYCTFL